MTPNQANQLREQDSWFRFWMPYAFVQLEHAGLKHVYFPVNRNYKPLGVTSDEHVEYESFLGQAIAFRRDPLSEPDIWTNTEPHLYLYTDSTASRLTYFARLERAMTLGGRLVEALEALKRDERSWGPSGRREYF